MPLINTEDITLLDLLGGILKQNQQYMTVIICSTRNDFLGQLIACVENYMVSTNSAEPQDEIPSSQNSDIDLKNSSVSKSFEHPFLKPTIQLLAASELVQVAFCPSIPTLRAYLSVFPLESRSVQNVSQRRIFVVDMLALHHGTSEFTIQGMTRSLSGVASLAHRTNAKIELIECRDPLDESNPHCGSGLWDVPVPLLSGSIKLGETGSRWAGKTFDLKKVASRWFLFSDKKLPL